jgi:hypothetical protein
MATLKIKRHDIGRSIEDQLLWGSDPMDLTNATVKLLLKLGPTVLTRTATIPTETATEGRVSYTLQPSDTAQAGIWQLEWEVSFPGGAVQSVPDDNHHRLIIVEDLG